MNCLLFFVRRFDTQKCGKDYYDVTVTKCLWHTACVEKVAKICVVCFATWTT